MRGAHPCGARGCIVSQLALDVFITTKQLYIARSDFGLQAQGNRHHKFYAP